MVILTIFEVRKFMKSKERLEAGELRGGPFPIVAEQLEQAAPGQPKFDFEYCQSQSLPVARTIISHSFILPCPCIQMTILKHFWPYCPVF
jgi:hypothetical protein